MLVFIFQFAFVTYFQWQLCVEHGDNDDSFYYPLNEKIELCSGVDCWAWSCIDFGDSMTSTAEQNALMILTAEHGDVLTWVWLLSMMTYWHWPLNLMTYWLMSWMTCWPWLPSLWRTSLLAQTSLPIMQTLLAQTSAAACKECSRSASGMFAGLQLARWCNFPQYVLYFESCSYENK